MNNFSFSDSKTKTYRLDLKIDVVLVFPFLPPSGFHAIIRMFLPTSL